MGDFGSSSLATLPLGFNCGFISTSSCGLSTGVCSWGCPGRLGFALVRSKCRGGAAAWVAGVPAAPGTQPRSHDCLVHVLRVLAKINLVPGSSSWTIRLPLASVSYQMLAAVHIENQVRLDGDYSIQTHLLGSLPSLIRAPAHQRPILTTSFNFNYLLQALSQTQHRN